MPADEAGQADRDAVEGLVEHRIQAGAVSGQGDPARQPGEKRHAQPVLQCPDLMAQRGLADAQLQGGAGEILVPCSGLEGAQGIERQLGAEHGRAVSRDDASSH